MFSYKNNQATRPFSHYRFDFAGAGVPSDTADLMQYPLRRSNHIIVTTFRFLEIKNNRAYCNASQVMLGREVLQSSISTMT
jgi:hypothetical protein